MIPDSILFTNPHRWAPVKNIEKALEGRGVKITILDRHNHTDGQYHKRFLFKGNEFDLNANIWDANKFKPLLSWYNRVEFDGY